MNFFESSYRLINKYNQKSKKAKNYGTEDLLYTAEVHMIDIIGSYEKTTTTKLAQILGITKGAVSQTAHKLLDKGLIVKSNSEDNKNEVYISLSTTGRTVFEYHKKMHFNMQKQIQDILNDLSPESVLAVEKIIQVIDESLDSI